MASRKPRGDADSVIAADVKAKKVQWLWKERIPLGMLTVVAGRPDQGKGLFAAHVAANVSKRNGNVLYSAVEDSNEVMTRPRLEAAGADLNRVLFWNFFLPAQIDELAAKVTAKQIKLIVIDPFNAHLSSGVSRQSDSIRRLTTPLAKLAEKANCAVLIVEHAVKKVGPNAHPLTAIGGSSSGLAAAARMAFVFGTDPQDAERRILASVKANLRDNPRAIAFETDAEEVGLVGEVPYMVMQGETDFDPKRLLGAGGEPARAGRRPDKRSAAAEWIATYLAGKGKPMLAKDVLEDGKGNGLTARTIRRAADDMGIVRRPAGGGPKCTWDLPPDLKKELGVKPPKKARASGPKKVKKADGNG